MDYKLIAIDLDDTLLNDDLRISDNNKESIVKAVEQGVMVTIATGRMFAATLPYIKELNLNIPVITYQGALIKNLATDEVILHNTLPLKYAKQIIEICNEDKLHLQAFIDDAFYYNEDNEYSKTYSKIIGIEGNEVGDLLSFVTNEPTKMIIIDEPNVIQQLKHKFIGIFGDRIHITSSKPKYLEFTHADANKGKSIEFLCSMYNIRREETIAIGDSYNDLTMIKYAGLGVAMGNSPDDVKSHADYVTKSNNEDGVSQVINNFILGR